MCVEIVDIIANAELLPRLGPASDSDDGCPIPKGIVGSTIIRFGTINRNEFPEWASPVESAAIVVDYLPAGATAARRAAFGVSELAAWVEYEDELRLPA